MTNIRLLMIMTIFLALISCNEDQPLIDPIDTSVSDNGKKSSGKQSGVGTFTYNLSDINDAGIFHNDILDAVMVNLETTSLVDIETVIWPDNQNVYVETWQDAYNLWETSISLTVSSTLTVDSTGYYDDCANLTNDIKNTSSTYDINDLYSWMDQEF